MESKDSDGESKSSVVDNQSLGPASQKMQNSNCNGTIDPSETWITASRSETEGTKGGGSDEEEEEANAESGDDEQEEEDDDDDKFMEPITDARLVTLRLQDLNQHLICRRCNGYFRCAHTIVECLHTFCKSCIYTYFAARNKTCPHCEINLGPNPHQSIMFDRTMQELVDKIMPHLEEIDEEEETTFYKKHGIKRKVPEETEKEIIAPTTPSKRDVQFRSSPGSDPEISFKLLPDTSTSENYRMKALLKPFLRTTGKLKVMHLKKYIAKKLGVKDSSKLEICCKGALLGPELSLQFIRRTRWFDNTTDLVLHYRKTQEY